MPHRLEQRLPAAAALDVRHEKRIRLHCLQLKGTACHTLQLNVEPHPIWDHPQQTTYAETENQSPETVGTLLGLALALPRYLQSLKADCLNLPIVPSSQTVLAAQAARKKMMSPIQKTALVKVIVEGQAHRKRAQTHGEAVGIKVEHLETWHHHPW